MSQETWILPNDIGLLYSVDSHVNSLAISFFALLDHLFKHSAWASHVQCKLTISWRTSLPPTMEGFTVSIVIIINENFPTWNYKSSFCFNSEQLLSSTYYWMAKTSPTLLQMMFIRVALLAQTYFEWAMLILILQVLIQILRFKLRSKVPVYYDLQQFFMSDNT